MPILPGVDFARAASRCTTRWRRRRVGSLRHQGRCRIQIQLDLRYVGQEFTLPVPVDPRAARGRRPRRHPHRVRRALRAPLRALIRRTSRSKMVNIRARRDRQAAAADLSEARRRRARAEPARTRQVYFDDAAEAADCPVYRARRRLARAQHSRARRSIQEHGTTTVLFARDSVRRSRHTGELHHHGQEAR